MDLARYEGAMLQATFVVLRLTELFWLMVSALTTFSSATFSRKVIMASFVVWTSVVVPATLVVISRGIARRLKQQAQRLKIYTTQKN